MFDAPVRMLFWWFTVCSLGWRTVQAGFDVIFEDVDCTEVNHEYIKACEVELNYDSTYGASLNSYLEIIKELPQDVKVSADMFSARMGEYTVDVGVHLDTDFCEVAQKENSVAIPMLRAINMDGIDTCPPKPGIYQKEDYVIDTTEGLPTSFPNGHYLLNLTFSSKDTTIMHFDAYIRVY